MALIKTIDTGLYRIPLTVSPLLTAPMAKSTAFRN